MTSVREDIGYTHAPKPRAQPARAKVEGTDETGDAVFGPWCATVLRPNGKRTWLYGKSEGEADDKAHEYARRVNG